MKCGTLAWFTSTLVREKNLPVQLCVAACGNWLAAQAKHLCMLWEHATATLVHALDLWCAKNALLLWVSTRWDRQVPLLCVRKSCGDRELSYSLWHGMCCAGWNGVERYLTVWNLWLSLFRRLQDKAATLLVWSVVLATALLLIDSCFSFDHTLLFSKSWFLTSGILVLGMHWLSG